MRKQLTILFLLLFTQTVKSFCQQSIRLVPKQFQLCDTEIDSLTKQPVYVTATTDPTPKDGINALMKKIGANLTIDFEIDKKNYDPHIIIAFIVDIDGSIKGSRIIKDKTNSIGQQMLDIVRSSKWTPAKCYTKTVTMIYQITLTYDPPD